MKSRLQIGVWLVALSGLLTTVWAADAPLKSYKDIPSPEGNARRITEVMRTELGLSEKQYKKVYKIQLEEQKKIFKYRPMPQRGESGREQARPREGGQGAGQGRTEARQEVEKGARQFAICSLESDGRGGIETLPFQAGAG
ncbi:hypothetical protein BARVI_05190 [Barnesiella viscericola DSM 18177]|uniref:Uncharacterized protein n=1 Tax=Barnesiella viscericola DSM 18177 TaxID=880074 RepID=W0EW26_9BACT|nr:hypothetical protein [Barnesiella viscericola]AHF13738.1 hypothetical protein BARVI_05190 [Barnesiella viscericola DSM 18177]